MKITLCSIGKPHDAALKQSVEDFSKRIANYYPTDWLIIAPPKNAGVLSADDLKKAEATTLLQQLAKDDYIVLLDERGKNISSPELASLIQQRGNESNKRIVFLIGGAFGVAEAIFKRANFTWALSKLVFPHMIVRLILAEQVYRACTILRNEKYHHI
ncbi:23S rRNA (pseudouridine(1915)-N(3))-methyltransferase RlmH [Parasediminibacterium sp. JCM 36343]|uniref:23S rRNA (pseudouridine(1915)-N(3))-methyltransferase RlmH n=1 Tax=Parasediminibacterium sp. JCM 36343 TaxID=3374279 RepID=UPI003979BA47